MPGPPARTQAKDSHKDAPKDLTDPHTKTSRIYKKTRHKPRKPTNARPIPSITYGGPFITVRVKNRLGLTTDIRARPNQNIGDLKRVVSQRLGTRPEDILLKRQGLRPFRDRLTLEDYEIGNGSCVDLEVDTGD